MSILIIDKKTNLLQEFSTNGLSISLHSENVESEISTWSVFQSNVISRLEVYINYVRSISFEDGELERGKLIQH